MPEVIITNKSDTTKGLEYGGIWHSTTGGARNYVEEINKGDKVEIREDDKGDVVFIRRIGPGTTTQSPDSTTLPTTPKPDRYSAVGDLYRMTEEKLNGIIEQNAKQDMKLEAIMKHFGLLKEDIV